MILMYANVLGSLLYSSRSWPSMAHGPVTCFCKFLLKHSQYPFIYFLSIDVTIEELNSCDRDQMDRKT